MGIRFILMVNKQGQTRLAQYYEYLTLEERRALEGEIVRKCLALTEQQVGLEYIEKRLRENGQMVIVIAEGAGQEPYPRASNPWITRSTEKQNNVVITDRRWARLLSSANQPSFRSPKNVIEDKRVEEPPTELLDD